MKKVSRFNCAKSFALIVSLTVIGAIAVFFGSRSSDAILPIAKAVDPDACTDTSAPANLLTYLGLEDAAGTASDSFDAKPGTLVNGPVWTASGKANRGLVFDGVDDHVTLGFNPSSFVNAFTFEAWVYPTKTNTLSYNQGIISNDNAAVQGIELSVGWASPTAACTVTTSVTRVGISAATTLNAWHHFTCTYNGATLRLYDNGAQVASAAATGTVVNNGVNLTLGRSLVYGIPAEEYFGGTLDEVAIYDRAISATEVSAHYQKGLAGNGYCVAVCGNSVTEGAETCDDGNTTSFDGCSSICATETDPDGDGLFGAADACNNTIAPSNLLTYLGFENGSGTTVSDSFDSRPGTLTNGPVWTVSGKVNSALQFDGVNDTVALGFNPSQFPSAYTFEAWAFPTKTNTGGFNQGIISNDNSSVQGQEMSVGQAVPKAACTATTSVSRVGISAVTTLNAWHHFACTYDGSTLKLYDNGSLMASAAATGTVTNNGVNLQLGRSQVYGSAEEYFGGTLDEAAVYSRALSSAEVTAHYLNGLASKGYCENVCGNGLIGAVEQCDDGNTLTEVCAYGLASCTVCNNTCQNVAGAISYCGDGRTQSPEQCDDGNSVYSDGCTPACFAETPGGGGGGGAGNINSSSNSDTSSVPTSIGTVSGNQSYSSPVQFSPNDITVNEQEQTKSAQVTENGTLTLKPNPKSTLSLAIPPETEVTGSLSWDGRIDPPVIQPDSVLGSKGEMVSGTQEKLLPSEVAVVVKVGSKDSVLTFSNKVKIEIAVTLPEGTLVKLYSSKEGDVWIPIGSAVVKDGKVVVETDHLSYFAVKKTNDKMKPVPIPSKTVPAPSRSALVASFQDVAGHWAEPFIQTLSSLGIMSGKSESAFVPDETVTQGEAIRIIEKAFSSPVPPSAFRARPNETVSRIEALALTMIVANVRLAPSFKAPFGDLDPEDPNAPYLATAAQEGVVIGYPDGKFRPNKPITRAELAKIVAKVLDLK